MSAIFIDAETQWMVFACFVVYFIGFLLGRVQVEGSATSGNRYIIGRTVSCEIWDQLARRLAAGPSTHGMAPPIFWLACTLFVNSVFYAIDYSPSTPALIILVGAVVGQGAATSALLENRSQRPGTISYLTLIVILLLLVLLALVSLWHADTSRFEYQSRVRWSGPWDNPNLFGLLMGTGFLLAIGVFGLRSFKKMRSDIWCLVFVILCFIAAGLIGRGLLHSYSRGAWLGVGCGGAYLVWSRIWGAGFKNVSFFLLKRNLPLAALVLVSVFVLMFWYLWQAEWPPVRRAFSAIRTEDFSWRNRVEAWQGALRITAEHPWFGNGWNQPEPLYEHYYLPPKLNESAAIEMNDYVMLGATLGVPALLCFGMYLWLSFFRGSRNVGTSRFPVDDSAEYSRNVNRPASLHDSDWLKTTCRAAALVLAVGFWFDGGLFKLATASTFWILLELGNVYYSETRTTREWVNHKKA